MPGLLDLKPADTPDIMAPAWIDCVLWAASEPEIVQRFRTETGNGWTPSKNAFEQMIDQATGADWGFVVAFVTWVNVNIWGPIDGPLEES